MSTKPTPRTQSEFEHEQQRYWHRANLDALKDLFAYYRIQYDPLATWEDTSVEDLIDWAETHAPGPVV